MMVAITQEEETLTMAEPGTSMWQSPRGNRGGGGEFAKKCALRQLDLFGNKVSDPYKTVKVSTFRKKSGSVVGVHSRLRKKRMKVSAPSARSQPAAEGRKGSKPSSENSVPDPASARLIQSLIIGDKLKMVRGY